MQKQSCRKQVIKGIERAEDYCSSSTSSGAPLPGDLGGRFFGGFLLRPACIRRDACLLRCDEFSPLVDAVSDSVLLPGDPPPPGSEEDSSGKDGVGEPVGAFCFFGRLFLVPFRDAVVLPGVPPLSAGEDSPGKGCPGEAADLSRFFERLRLVVSADDTVASAPEEAVPPWETAMVDAETGVAASTFCCSLRGDDDSCFRRMERARLCGEGDSWPDSGACSGTDGRSGDSSFIGPGTRMDSRRPVFRSGSGVSPGSKPCMPTLPTDAPLPSWALMPDSVPAPEACP